MAVLNEFAERASNYQIPVHLRSHDELVTQFSYLNPEQKFQGGLVLKKIIRSNHMWLGNDYWHMYKEKV